VATFLTKIKYVKKARMWCKTFFTFGDKGTPIQHQEWSVDKPNEVRDAETAKANT